MRTGVVRKDRLQNKDSLDYRQFRIFIVSESREQFFRCNVLADNIGHPLTGDDFNHASAETKAWSNDLKKIDVGFIQFGLTYGSASSW